ncbi:MAG: ThiF family adenylyltransferase [Gemmatimonadaceae bacterium]|jgi:adenylyltransferase/sulfurtransferase|nr:ThiF family adenylyltransferase [Gemmatimonadaceae bacterium]
MSETSRYARQLTLPEFGVHGQARLARARVVIVGVGGLGAPIATYLAGAGVGHLTLVDDDVVALHNLHRQPLYTEADVGRAKVECAATALRARNGTITIVPRAARVTASNADAIVTGHDLVLDGTDTLPTRYALTDACVRAGVPLVYGSVSRLEGQMSVFGLGNGPCYRCLFPEMPDAALAPSCAEQGVLGVVPGVIALLQATEALKVLSGLGTPLAGRLLHADLSRGVFHEFMIAARTDCACRAPAAVAARAAWTAAMTPSSTPHMAIPQLTASDVHYALRGEHPPRLIDVREPWEYETAHIEGAELMPMGGIPLAVQPGGALAELPRDTALIIQCHHGGRSNQVAHFLAGQGFTNVSNFDGGIDAWSIEIDPSVPRY